MKLQYTRIAMIVLLVALTSAVHGLMPKSLVTKKLHGISAILQPGAAAATVQNRPPSTQEIASTAEVEIISAQRVEDTSLSTEGVETVFASGPIEETPTYTSIRYESPVLYTEEDRPVDTREIDVGSAITNLVFGSVNAIGSIRSGIKEAVRNALNTVPTAAELSIKLHKRSI